MPEQVARFRPNDQASTRPTGPSAMPHNRAGLHEDEDPLAELARIVAEDGQAYRQSTSPTEPYASRDHVGARREYARRDTSWRDPANPSVVRSSLTPQPMPGHLEDLEAELYNELRSSAPEPQDDRRRHEPVFAAEDPREAVTQMISPRAAQPRSDAARVEVDRSVQDASRAPIAPVAAVQRPSQRDTWAPSAAHEEVTLPMSAVPRQPQAATRTPVAPDQYEAAQHYDDPAYDHDPAGAFAPVAYDDHYDDQTQAAHYAADRTYPNATFDEFGAPEIAAAARESQPRFAAEQVMPEHPRAERAAARTSAQGPRRGMAIAAAAVGIFALGALGFVGYRAVTGTESTSSGTPLIRADTKPMKEVPPTQPLVATGPNLDAMRADTPGKLVTRQEDPVDQIPGKSPVRVIGSTGPSTPSNSLAPVQKVRSVVVRTDGTIVTPEGEALAPKPAPSSPIRTSSINAADTPAPVIDNTPKPVVTAPPAPVLVTPKPAAAIEKPPVVDKPVAVVKPPVVVAPPTAKPAPTTEFKPVRPALAPQPTATEPAAPLTLAPTARVATATPAPASVTPAPAKPLTADVSGSDFMVQISSQRSDAEARKALQDAQRKYSALGVHGGDVQQADLGARGTYFRARLAAGSREQAQALCTQIKAQGGDCVVAKR